MALTLEQEARLEQLRSRRDELQSQIQGEKDKYVGEVGEAFVESNAGDPDLKDISNADLATAMAADIAISEGGRLAATAAGSAIPVLGTAAGWVAGGLAAGAAGSITRQKMLGQDIDYGAVVADSLLNIIPVAKGFKLFKNKTLNTAAFQGVAGAGLSSGAETIQKVVSEDRLPTIGEIESAGIRGGVLGAGLGIAGSKLENAYKKYSGVSRDDFNRALEMGDPDAKILVDGVTQSGKEYADNVRKNYSDMRLSLKELTMDSRARLQELQQTSGGGQLKAKDGPFKTLGDDTDYNMNARLAEAIIAGRNTEVKNIFDLDSQFLSNKADDLGVEVQDLSQSIDKYLYAKHALTFNKIKKKEYTGEGSPAGISDVEAKDIIKNFEKSGLDKELASVVDSRTDLSKQILDTLVDGGLYSKEYAAKLRKRYPDYVPLDRIMDDDTANFAPGKYDAVGSSRSINDLSANIIGNLSSAIRAAELNKANQSFLRLVESKPNVKAAKDIVSVYRPEAVKAGAKSGQPKLPPKTDRDSVVTVYDKGVPTALSFKDPNLASAMKGQNKAILPTYMKAALWYNRTLGALYTRYNPEFIIPNLFRDRSEAIVRTADSMGIGQALKLTNPVTDVRTIRRGILNKGKISEDPKLGELDALYQQFLKDGGSTGSLGAATLRDPEEAIKALQKSLHQGNQKGIIKKGFDALDRVNSYVEDSTRFQVYRRGLESGMTRKQAALAARDSSFDPLVRGTQGEAIRAAYLFANPAIQGGRNFIRSMRNPRILSGVMTAMMGSTLALDLYNQSIDPDWKEKLRAKDGSTWKTDKTLTFVTSGGEGKELEYIQVPIGYSIAPFKKVADYVQQRVIQQGLMGRDPSQREADMSIGEKAAELGKAFIDGYNPMGGSLWPTPMRPWVELSQNKDGLGRDIRPSWLETKNISETEKTFPWTMDTRGGEMAMSFAEQLKNMGMEVSPENLLYLYQTWVGGPGNFVKRLFEVSSRIYNGEPIPKNQVPVLRRFYGDTPRKTFEARNYNEEVLDNLDNAYGTARAKATRLASSTFSKMQRKKTTAEKRLIVSDVIRENPDLAEAIVKSLNTKLEEASIGMTSADKRLKALPSLAKAEYFVDRLEDMPREQVPEYVRLMQQRKVLTPKVIKLVQELQALRSSAQ
jgi:hypothetical protein